MHPLIKRIKRMQYIMEKGRSDLEFFGTLFCTDCVYYSSNGIGISHHGSCTVGNSFKRVTTIKDTHRTDGKTWSVPDTSDGICLDWFHYHEVGAQ